jgi:hypothetical protein
MGGGHLGIQATYKRLQKIFYWQGMKLSVESYVKQCSICQQAKHELCKYLGLLQSLHVPSQSWTDISMDFIEGLPTFSGYIMILVVVDRFTKYNHFLPIKHPFTTAYIAQVFMDNIVKLHGVPTTSVCDRDKVFTSNFWTELFKLLKIELKFSSACHPQTNDQTERVNQCLEILLRWCIQTSPKVWSKWLSLVELWYNTTYHSSLQCSPFKVLYGTNPSPSLVPTLRSTDHHDVFEVLKERQLFAEMLKEQLTGA